MNVPAHIAARIAARQQAGTKSTVASAIVSDGPSIPRISIRAGRYRLVEDGVETPVGVTLDTIIVGANPRVSKVFYAKQFDASASDVRPDCWSNDGLKPDASVQAPVHTGCADCPNNVLGSKVLPSGAKSKMCADQRHLAVVAAADPSKVYSLTVPVSGMKALREYFKELGNYGIGPEEVVTELGFDDAASFPKIVFKQKGYVPEKAISRVDALLESDNVKVATRMIAPQAAGPALAAPKQAPQIAAPAVDDAYEEEEPKPIKAATPVAKPAVAPVKASDELASKLDSLFDE
ncbi:MAG: hypothetical protein ACKOW0_00730 [Schleiferiaceae bacterium]